MTEQARTLMPAGADLPEGGKARRVYLLLRDEIAGGQRPAGSALPSEQQLSRMHGVSRVTIRRALDALVANGLIRKKVGSGSVVCETTPTITGDLSTLITHIVSMGRGTEARLMSFAYQPAPPAVAKAMNLAPGAMVQHAVRIRLAEGEPFSHLTTYVPEQIARNYSEAELAGAPMFALLERSGARIESARQWVSAVLASPEVAGMMQIAVGSALLSLTRVIHDADGKGVEYLSALYRPDRFRLEMALNRVGNSGRKSWQPVVAGGLSP